MKLRTTGAAALQTIDLPDGASLTVSVWDSSALVAGRTAYAEAIASGRSNADAEVAFTAGAVSQSAVAWSGVLNEDDDAVIPFDRPLVHLLIVQQAGAYDAVDKEFVLPALRIEAEKKGSASGQVGDGPA